MLEAWLVLTSIKYRDNLLILMLLNQWLALTMLQTTGIRAIKKYAIQDTYCDWKCTRHCSCLKFNSLVLHSPAHPFVFLSTFLAIWRRVTRHSCMVRNLMSWENLTGNLLTISVSVIYFKTIHSVDVVPTLCFTMLCALATQLL